MRWWLMLTALVALLGHGAPTAAQQRDPDWDDCEQEQDRERRHSWLGEGFPRPGHDPRRRGPPRPPRHDLRNQRQQLPPPCRTRTQTQGCGTASKARDNQGSRPYAAPRQSNANIALASDNQTGHHGFVRSEILILIVARYHAPSEHLGDKRLNEAGDGNCRQIVGIPRARHAKRYDGSGSASRTRCRGGQLPKPTSALECHQRCPCRRTTSACARSGSGRASH